MGGFRSRTRSEQNKARREKSQSPQPVKEKKYSSWEEVSWGGSDAARKAAVATIYAVHADAAFGNLVLDTALKAYEVRGRGKGFATELCYGTLRSLAIVDAAIEKVAGRAISDIEDDARSILEMGAYQLLYTHVDSYAAVDSSVNLAPRKSTRSFINGVLRGLTRAIHDAGGNEKFIQLLAQQQPNELARIAFENMHPEWIARSFATSLGVEHDSEELRAALEADSARPITHLVARPGIISAEELALMCGGEEGQYSPYCVYLPSGAPYKVDAVREGMAAVQDEGSQIIARAVVEAPLIGPDSGKWLDLCAGPGGKAALMGSIAAIDHAEVTAIELAPHRAELVRKSTKGLPVTVKVADGTDPGLEEASFDRILVDAPCSGLGSLRRRPESRWIKNESIIDELVPLQKALVHSAIKLLRPGGVIIYSTCSPDMRETRDVVDSILGDNPQMQELSAKDLECGMGNTGPYKSVTMWPHRHGTDAMFFAVLQKRVDE